MTRIFTRVKHSLARPSWRLDYRGIIPSVQTWTWILVGVGVLLRVVEYAGDRPLYMDERLLLANLVDLPIFDFHTVLKDDQIAAPGFLILERMMVRLPLPDIWAARLIPVLCGIASMFLMRLVARRYLLPCAVPLAVGLFALNDWSLYYSAEIKQYSSDITLTLCALLLAAAASSGGWREIIAVAGFGAVAVWFSHPLALVLGAVGTYLAAKTAMRRDWKMTISLLAVGLLWVASFAACYLVSHRILSRGQFIWKWWDFAFLRIPPRSWADLTRDFWQLLNIFNSPGWVITPLGVLMSAFLAMALFLIGSRSMSLRWRGGLYLLVAPLLFTIAASALRQYPFHGRLILFLVPMIHLPVAEGAVALVRRKTVFTVAVTIFLLCQPAAEILWNTLIIARGHDRFDTHGDLLPDLLDYLDSQKTQSAAGRVPR